MDTDTFNAKDGAATWSFKQRQAVIAFAVRFANKDRSRLRNMATATHTAPRHVLSCITNIPQKLADVTDVHVSFRPWPNAQVLQNQVALGDNEQDTRLMRF